jgi:hypothetical protein
MDDRRTGVAASTQEEAVPDRGTTPDPNPGERSALADASGAPLSSLGIIPSRGNRAGGGQEIDTGAQVGILRNLEFTAGGRAHRLVTGTFSSARPAYDPKSGRLHTSTASDTGDPSLGPKSPSPEHKPMTPEVEGAGATNDTSPGDTSPDRRRDTKTT